MYWALFTLLIPLKLGFMLSASTLHWHFVFKNLNVKTSLFTFTLIQGFYFLLFASYQYYTY